MAALNSSADEEPNVLEATAVFQGVAVAGLPSAASGLPKAVLTSPPAALLAATSKLSQARSSMYSDKVGDGGGVAQPMEGVVHPTPEVAAVGLAPT